MHAHTCRLVIAFRRCSGVFAKHTVSFALIPTTRELACFEEAMNGHDEQLIGCNRGNEEHSRHRCGDARAQQIATFAATARRLTLSPRHS